MVVLGIPRTKDSIRKRLYGLFKKLNFNVSVEMKSEVVQKLDLELNLLAGTVSRFTVTNTNNTLNIYKYQVCLPDK